MPRYRERTVDLDPLGMKKDLRESESAAEKLDAQPELAGVAEKENLVVVLHEHSEEPFSGSRQRLSWDKIRALSIPELLSVGYDRGYWKKGVAKLSNEELRAFFSNAQEGDTSLDS